MKTVKYILSLFLVLIILSSCASRKVNKEVIIKDEKTEIKTLAKDSAVINRTKLTEYNQEISEFEIGPIDSTKDITINGMVINNARLKVKKTKSNSLHYENEKVSKTSLKQADVIESIKSKEVKKETVRKSSNLYLYIILFLLILLVIAYRKYIIKLIFPMP
jgi:hypothetical protein